MMIRIGDHIIHDDPVTNSRRGRIPTNIINTNRNGTGGTHTCPDCMRRPYGSKLVNMYYDKELQAFVCPVCWGMRSVNPLSRNEMQPGTSNPIDAIPSIDGVTEQQAIARDVEGNSGRTRSKPIMRSINNVHERSQYSSEQRGFSHNGSDGVIIPKQDQELRDWAERNNATVVSYNEYIPQDNNTFSSENLGKRRARLEV